LGKPIGLGTFQFPWVRTQEEFEIAVGAIKTFQVERIEKSYKRLKVDWNEDRNIAGFWSEVIIELKWKIAVAHLNL
jgi:hypothetical protein